MGARPRGIAKQSGGLQTRALLKAPSGPPPAPLEGREGGKGDPSPKRRGAGGAHRPVLELPHLLLMGFHAGLILHSLPGQLELCCLQGDARGLSPPRSGGSGTPPTPRARRSPAAAFPARAPGGG